MIENLYGFAIIKKIYLKQVFTDRYFQICKIKRISF